MRDKLKAFLQLCIHYYEWIVAIAGAIVLIGFAVVLILKVNNLQTEIKQQDEARPKGADPKGGDFKTLEAIETAIQNPLQWTTNQHRVFIAPLMKQTDPNDPFPQVWNPDVGTQTPERLPIVWLQKHSLPTTVPVANTDPDGDGFTVREEYDSGTDPKNAASKPDAVFKLRTAQLIQKPFPFIFNGVAESSTGMKFSVLRRDGKVNYYVKMDEVIADPESPGFRVVQYAEKYNDKVDPTIRGPDGRPLKTKFDVSELTLRRGSDQPVVLIKGGQAILNDLFAKVYFVLEDRYFEVGMNSIFTLEDAQYQVISIKKLDAQKAEVVVRKLDSGKEFQLRSLSPDEIKKHS